MGPDPHYLCMQGLEIRAFGGVPKRSSVSCSMLANSPDISFIRSFRCLRKEFCQPREGHWALWLRTLLDIKLRDSAGGCKPRAGPAEWCLGLGGLGFVVTLSRAGDLICWSLLSISSSWLGRAWASKGSSSTTRSPSARSVQV